MEKFQELRDNAKKKLNVADHLLLVTFPMVQDPKLLLAVVENLASCYELGMNSILEYERLFKRINILPEAFEPRFKVFKGNVAPRHNIKSEHVELLKELKDIIESHKESPIEFTRENKLIICTDSYKMKTLAQETIKKNINKAKDFLAIVDDVVSENEGIFGRS